MKQLTQIFLDLDGPLLDGKERHYFCYRHILESFGLKPIGIEKYWELKRALVNRKVLLRMSDADSIYDDFLVQWLTMIESPAALALDRIQQGGIECLRNWKEQGLSLRLVTMRKNLTTLEAQLESTGLRPFMDSVLICDHVNGGIGKAEAVLAHLHGQLNPDSALWIGDTEADWQAAKSLGCDVVLLANGLRNEEYLRTLAGARVEQSIVSITESVARRFYVN